MKILKHFNCVDLSGIVSGHQQVEHRSIFMQNSFDIGIKDSFVSVLSQRKISSKVESLCGCNKCHNFCLSNESLAIVIVH